MESVLVLMKTDERNQHIPECVTLDSRLFFFVFWVCFLQAQNMSDTPSQKSIMPHVKLRSPCFSDQIYFFAGNCGTQCDARASRQVGWLPITVNTLDLTKHLLNDMPTLVVF